MGLRIVFLAGALVLAGLLVLLPRLGPVGGAAVEPARTGTQSGRVRDAGPAHVRRPTGDSRTRPRILAGDTQGQALLSGRIVYATTGQGVPFCEAIVGRSGRVLERVETDGDGRFETGAPLRFGALEVLALDRFEGVRDWGKAVRVEHSAGAPDAVIEVDLWPTYALDLELPRGLSALELHGTIEVEAGGGSRIAFPAGLSPSPVRGAGPFFWRAVALKGPEDLRRHSPPAKLVLRDAVGYWLGSAPVSTLDGVAPRPVVVSLEPRGRLAIRLRGLDGGELPDEQVEVFLDPHLAGGTLRAVHSMRPREELVLEDLDPGTHRLRAEVGLYDPAEVSVSVPEAGTASVEIALRIPPPVETRISVRSQSGDHHEPACLELTSTRGSISLRVDWELVDGAWIGSAVCEPPQGEYEVRLDLSAPFGVYPAQTVAARAGDTIELLVLDLASATRLGFLVRDAETGAALDGFAVSMDPGGLVRDTWTEGVRSGDVVFALHEGARLSWTLSMPGYACAFGTEADFTIEQRAGLRLAEVRLQRGWSLRVVAYDDETGSALHGAEVYCDGALAGRTDEEGVFAMNMERPPGELSVSLDGWRISYPDELESPADWEPCGEVYVGLQRIR